MFCSDATEWPAHQPRKPFEMPFSVDRPGPGVAEHEARQPPRLRDCRSKPDRPTPIMGNEHAVLDAKFGEQGSNNVSMILWQKTELVGRIRKPEAGQST